MDAMGYESFWPENYLDAFKNVEETGGIEAKPESAKPLPASENDRLWQLIVATAAG